MTDRKLIWWSTALLLLAIAAAAQSVIGPLSLLADGNPVVLKNGPEIWQFTFQSLQRMDATILTVIILLPQVAWISAAWQVARLAIHYRRGGFFSPIITTCFLRLGMALAAMGALDSLAYPAVDYIFYWRGVSPWLGDVPVLAILRLDLMMAGAFFFILGKIMTRGKELQDLEQFTI